MRTRKRRMTATTRLSTRSHSSMDYLRCGCFHHVKALSRLQQRVHPTLLYVLQHLRLHLHSIRKETNVPKPDAHAVMREMTAES